MPTYMIVNAAGAALVICAVVGLLYWAIVTQHRDPRCAEVRLGLRLSRVTLARRARAAVPAPHREEAEPAAEKIALA